MNETNEQKDQDAKGTEDDKEAGRDKDEDEDVDTEEENLEAGHEDALIAASGASFNPVINEIQIISTVTRQGVEVVVGGPVSITK